VPEGEKKFPLMLVISLVVVGLLLAGGISYFIATKIVADKGDKKVTREPGVFMKLGDAKDGLVLNIGGVNSGRYLKIGLIAELKPVQKQAAKEGKMPSAEEIKILDTAVRVLRSQKIEDFEPGKQEALKETIKSKINEALGQELVYEIYITNFVLQ